MADDYAEFLAGKLTRVPATGLTTVPDLHPSLFAFQRDLVTWALKRGRAAIFCDTGLGKTRQQLEWARVVAEFTQKPTLILTPLAVAMQTVREAEVLGNMIAKKCLYQGDVVECMVAVTNYDRLHHFDPSAFGAVVLDESSLIKNDSSKTLAALMSAFAQTPFRLCCTATPAPNDYTELGTHAEFLGVCTREEMLAEFFCHDGSDTSKWRLKGHARGQFWRWVSTWGALLRRPSDLGYDNAGYDLPPLNVETHVIAADPEATKAAGLLFAEPANTLTERRTARRETIGKRVAMCADMVMASREAYVVWCELNAEQDALAKAFGEECVSIMGPEDSFTKEVKLGRFLNGEVRVLVTKPKIAGAGLNMQFSHKMAFVGVSDSFERTYQAIRRQWRFGQMFPVDVTFFASELEGNVIANYQRKERDAVTMAEQLSIETREAVRAEISGSTRMTNDYSPARLKMPEWLESEA